jgi:protein XRP2
MSSAAVDEETIQATQDLITRKLMENGQLLKMQAMVIEASLKALNAEDPDGDQLFHQSAHLKAEKKSETGVATLSLVRDYLKSLGLLYTASVLEMEAGGADIFKPRAELAKKYSVSATPETTPILNLVLASGKPAAGGAAAPVSTPAPAAAEKKEPAAGASISKEAVSAGVAAVLAKTSQAPTTGAVAPQNPKSKETPYLISNWVDREFERINQVKGQQVAIEDLKNCKIFVYDAVDSITMDACEDCELVVAACEGSIFIRECKNVKLTIACKQLRFRDSTFCNVYLFASTDPVVESSHHITFYPFNAQLPKLKDRFKEARLDPTMNRFVHVYDFTEDDPSLQKPHFVVKYPDHGLKGLVSFGQKHGTPEAPAEVLQLLEGKIEPAPSSESGKNKSQNIKTGGALWNKSSEEAAPAPAAAAPKAAVTAPAAAAPAKTSAAPAAKPAAKSPEKSDESDYSSFEDDDEF